MNIDGSNILILIFAIVICSFLLYWIVKNSINNSALIIELKKAKEELVELNKKLEKIQKNIK